MADPIRPVLKAARGLATVARRRGIGYFGYLVHGVAWPRAAFRFGWGPSAPPLMQGVFAAAGEFAADKPSRDELLAIGLLGHGPAATARDVRTGEAERLLDRAHAAGVTGVARSFDRLVRAADGSLHFSDVDGLRKHRPGTLAFAAARDADRRAFNRRFSASLMTEESARTALEELRARVPANYRNYAPIDFGVGLTLGQVASSDSGTGRWEVFNRHVVGPLVVGRRVLDLGANNGSLPLMMLREGAREVVAVEHSPALADLARLNARIMAWRDMRSYQLQVLTGDMRLFLTQDLGHFDVVTAFCSLYYLPKEDMARVVRRAAAMDAVLVLQANEAIENDLPGRTLDLLHLMRDNGYSEIAVHTPSGFARPLLVGETLSSIGARRLQTAART